ncbi:MAG: glycosyltransferase [Bacteroidales bacterium]|nr:glycosyltransferase [Bacteroidales bacterium]MCK4639330.1 glycosyltransferase [Bacteroidales bacterium]
MCTEKPIIASNCAPIERIINETKTGITYQHDSPEELATKLKYIISNKKSLHDLYSNGKNAVLSKYNWETDKQYLLNIYSK